MFKDAGWDGGIADDTGPNWSYLGETFVNCSLWPPGSICWLDNETSSIRNHGRYSNTRHCENDGYTSPCFSLLRGYSMNLIGSNLGWNDDLESQKWW